MLTKLKFKSEFSRNVLTLMTGTTIAQATPNSYKSAINLYIYSLRFSVFTLYMSIASAVAVIAMGRCGGYYIMLKKIKYAL